MSKPTPKPEVKKPAKTETFYRVVQHSMYAWQLESVQVDVNSADVVKVGEADIKSVMMQRFTSQCE